MMDGIDLYAFGTTPNFDSIVVQNFISGPSGGPLHLLADPVGPLDAVTKEYVDTGLAESIPGVGTVLPTNPVPGQLWWSSIDGQLYIYYPDPNSNQWVIANNTGVQDAPVGPAAYGRQNGHWVPVMPLTGGIMTGPLVLSMDPTTYFMAATKGYVDVSLGAYLPLTGGTVSGQLLLTQDPTVAHGAATKQYVDAHTGVVIVSDTAPASPIPGQLWFDSIGVQLYVWYLDGGIASWVQTNAPAFTEGSAGGGGGGGAGFPEAPVTGFVYGRDGSTQSWQRVLPLIGGTVNTMAGPLMLWNSSPVQDDEAASKRYVDDAVSSGTLWQGNYIVALNDPDLTAVTPVDNGFAWTAITQDPNVPENLLVTLPGIAAGTLIYNGDSLRYNGVDNLWFQLRGSSLTRTEADSIYVFRDGDTMIGDLYLAGTPFAPTMAADKQYVDSTKVVVSSLPPATPFEGQLWYDLSDPNLYIWVVDPTSSQWVIAVNPGAAATAPPLGRTMVDFDFPINPVDGQIVVTPSGARYVWSDVNQRWEYIPLTDVYVNISGDTMTGDLFVSNPADGSGVIRISGSDQNSARIRFRKNNSAQWMLDADETHFRLLNYAPDGAAGRTAWEVDPANNMWITNPTSNHVPTVALDLTNKQYVDAQIDTRVAKTGDTMTGQLRLTNGDIEIDHPANAIIRLIGPDASAIGFKRNPNVNDPQWIMGVNRTLAGSMAADSLSFVRFPTGNPAVYDIPLELDYNAGDVWVERARARRLNPLFADELVTRQYVDQRFAGESLFIGLLDASTGLVLTVPGHGPPPQGPIPAPGDVPVGAYYICNVPGVIPASSPQLPGATFYLADWLITAGTVWTRIPLGVSSAAANNISLIPPVFNADNVQAGMEEAERQVIARLPLIGGTLVGPLQGPSFQCNADGGGFITFGLGVFYKRSGAGGGLVLRAPTSNAQPQIENNDGSNVRNILDSLSGMPVTGGQFTGGIGFGSASVIDLRDVSRHIALFGGGTSGYGLNMTTNHMNLVAAANATSRVGFVVGGVSTYSVEVSTAGVHLPLVTPTQPEMATTKQYVDNAVTAAPRVWTAGQNYTVGSVVMWDGMPFTVITAITNAPATPNYSTIRLSAGSQGDYWQGVPGGWAANNWIHIATMVAGGTYRMHIDCVEVSHTGVYMLDIATTYTKANLTVTTYVPYGNGIFKAFRLSANGGLWNPVRLEAQFAAPLTSGAALKLVINGFANENTNLTTIPKPPTGTAANLGGTQYHLIEINPGTAGNTAEPSFITRSLQTSEGGWIRFPHANATNRDDGRISARLHSKGLNIVGSATEAGDTMRYVSIYGDVEVTGTNKIIARTFTSRDDNFGFETFAGGWFYKKSGTGLVIRKTSGGQQPQIEENNGTNPRPIIDTLNGDARYAPVSTRAYAAAWFPRVHSQGADAGIGNNPPTLRPNSNAIYVSNANWNQNLYLPALNYMANNEAFFFESQATNNTIIHNDRTNMAANLTLTTNNSAVFVKNNITNLYDYVGTYPYGSLPGGGQVNMLGNAFNLPRNRGGNGQTIVSDGAGGTLWGAGAAAGNWQNLTITAGWTSAASPLRARWVAGATLAIEMQGRINSPSDYNGGFTTCATLPTGLRPTQTQIQYTISCYSNGSANYGIARLTIAANTGAVGVQPVLPVGMTGNIDFYVSGIIAPLN